MKFIQVAETFDAINNQSGRIEITKLLAKLLVDTTAEEAQIISYISLGLLQAPYKGTQFALAEKSIKKLLADLFHVSPSIIEERSQLLGDLGLVLLEYPPFRQDEQLSVVQVYNYLVELENASGTGSQETKQVLLKNLLQAVSPLSGSFIIRIVLGKLRLGFSDMTFIDALSWMLTGNKSLHERIERAYNICADIGLITYTLKKDGVDALDSMNIHLGIPVRPAAAERAASATDVIERLGLCVAQPKIDGFRLQIHKKNNKVWFFSRNLLDMSDMFPDLVKELLKLPADNYIIEGEAIVYDEQTGNFVPFQQTIKRKRKHDIDSAADEFPLTFLIFDLLYADNTSWLDKTHKKRRSKLIDLFGLPHEGLISVIPEKEVDNAQLLEHYFLNALTEGFEGLVVKKIDSIYQAGKRNFNWIKLKRQQGTQLQDSIDAVILGYYAGRGKRAAFGIGAFLVGAFDPQTDSFKTIAKVGTGLSDEQWRSLKSECDQLIIIAQPSNVICDAILMPTVWISPKIVCEIRADELTVSPSHSAGLALRFPRFIQLRPDKSPEQATTINELQELYQIAKKEKIN